MALSCLRRTRRTGAFQFEFMLFSKSSDPESFDALAGTTVEKLSHARRPRAIVNIQLFHARRLRKILICGLTGDGETTLCQLLAPHGRGPVQRRCEIRANINKDLGFSHQDRIEHARRMGWLCDRISDAGSVAITDFVCPTPQTRAAFGEAFIIRVDRLSLGRFDDTNKLFAAPASYDIRVGPESAPEYWVEKILTRWSGGA